MILERARGEVVSDFEKRDVEIRLAFPPWTVDAPGPSWAATSLVRIGVQERLRRRLRAERGLVYFAHVHLNWASDAILLEVETSARPEDAPTVFRALVDEVETMHREGLAPAEADRARLTALKRLAGWPDDPRLAVAPLRWMVRLDDVPERPHLELLNVSEDQVGIALRALIDPNRFAFTVRGPLTEESILEFDAT